MSDVSTIRLQYQDLITRSHDVFEGVDEELAAQRPSPGRWSMAECIAHLNITG